MYLKIKNQTTYKSPEICIFPQKYILYIKKKENWQLKK